MRRLIVNVPPRSIKSITAAVAFPAWVLGQDPTRRIICVSYAEELARKLAVDTRTVLHCPPMPTSSRVSGRKRGGAPPGSSGRSTHLGRGLTRWTCGRTIDLIGQL